MAEIDTRRPAALKPWLDRAIEGVAVEPAGLGWNVIVHNGREGEEREEAVVCWCEDHPHAELIGHALWALVI